MSHRDRDTQSTYAFRMDGRVPPKGSARSFAIKRGGRYTGRTVTVQQNADDLASWAARLAWTAKQIGVECRRGPWFVEAYVMFERPKAHYRAGEKAKGLKASAPGLPTGRPDLDKLLRTILDALTGVAWADDSQVVSIEAAKIYGDRQGLDLRLISCEAHT